MPVFLRVLDTYNTETQYSIPVGFDLVLCSAFSTEAEDDRWGEDEEEGRVEEADMTAYKFL